MPQRGRPPQPGTAEEKAAIRREKVRLYVKAHRERKRIATTSSPSEGSPPSEQPPSSSQTSTTSTAEDDRSNDGPRSNEIIRQEPAVQVEPTDAVVEEGAIQPYNSAIQGDNQQTALAMPIGPSSNKNLALGLIGVFRAQFLPEIVRLPVREAFGSELVTPCSAWVMTAHGIALRDDSNALRSCVLAVGLAVTGMLHQDERLKLMSRDVYQRALRQVRRDIKSLSTGQTESYLAPYLCCLAASLFEIVHDGYSGSIQRHVQGAATLIALLPRDPNVNHLLSDILLDDLCMLQMIFALQSRRPSQTLQLKRNNGSRRYQVDGDPMTRSRHATILGDLLEGPDEIPAIMSRIDRLKETPDTLTDELALKVEVEKLDRILKGLSAWSIRTQRRFGPFYAWEDQDPNNRSISQDLKFVSYELAAAWVYCLTFTLCAIETTIEALVELIRLHEVQYAPESAIPVKRRASVVPTIVSYEWQNQPSQVISNKSVRDADCPSHSSIRDFQRLNEKLLVTRARLRSTLKDIVEAACAYLPIEKGVIGQSFILFPLNRCQNCSNRELSRLAIDLANKQAEGIENDAEITQAMNQLDQILEIRATLEQTLMYQGMSPMPDD